MSALDCCSPCAAPQITEVPGPQGDDGSNGSNGINAFSFVGGAGFTIPAIGATVGVTLDTSQWMVIGQIVVVDGPASFQVTAVPTDTSATLKFLGYFGDLAAGTAMAAGLKVSPAGVSGTLVGAVAENSVATPTASASAVQLMMGLARTITPIFSGRVLVVITGMIWNDTATKIATVQIRYGTGAAPVNGAAAAGTTLGLPKHHVSPTGPGKQGFALAYFATGLTVATTYWVDVGLAADANNAAIFDVDTVVVEL